MLRIVAVDQLIGAPNFFCEDFVAVCSILLARVSWIQRFVKEQAFIAGLTARREGLIVAVLVGMLVLLPRTGCAQAPPLDGKSGRELLLRNFRPVPMLKVPVSSC